MKHQTMTSVRRYQETVAGTLDRIAETQSSAIERAAELVSAVIEREGIVYAFGSGHSMLPGIEMYFRAGGLACVDIIDEKTFGRAERLSGYARVLLRDCPIGPNDLLLIVSNSGRNALPVEMALEARERGIPTICITSLAHSRSVQPREGINARLCEVCDIVIDNCGVAGDAALEVTERGGTVRVGPTSTLAAVFVCNAIVAASAEILLARGVRPPVLQSMNLDGGDADNRAVLERFKGRIRGI
jgi:uncharacterized phosphosugar-binding protein